MEPIDGKQSKKILYFLLKWSKFWVTTSHALHSCFFRGNNSIPQNRVNTTTIKPTSTLSFNNCIWKWFSFLNTFPKALLQPQPKGYLILATSCHSYELSKLSQNRFGNFIYVFLKHFPSTSIIKNKFVYESFKSKLCPVVYFQASLCRFLSYYYP